MARGIKFAMTIMRCARIPDHHLNQRFLVSWQRIA